MGVQVVHRNVQEVEIPAYCWKPLKPLKTVYPNIAFDTETVKGRAFLIVDSNGTKEEDIQDLDKLLEYLNYYEYRKTVNWFYNLEYDTNAILKYLEFDKRKEVAFDNVTDYKDFRIQIIPKKELRISKIKKDGKIHHTTCFYDLAQFYEMQRLKTLALQTSYRKVDVEDIQNIDLNKYKTDKEYKELINERCFTDSKITKELADKFTEKISPIVKLNKYKSKASIARRCVLENLNKQLRLPSLSIIQSALNAYHAGHIEACKLGIFNNIKNYDINSAYPSVMTDLYDCRGAYKHNKAYEPDTAYSFYLIIIDYQDDNLTPIWVNVHNKNYHPNGKVEIWVSQSEIEFFMNKGFDFKIIKAYHLLKKKNQEQPLKELVNYLYEKRLEAKKDGDPIQLTYKIILNSIYGVTVNTISKKEISDTETDIFEIDKDSNIIFYKETFKATNMYNPLFTAYICANTRVKLFTDFYKHLDKLVSVNTDGVYLLSGNGVKVSKKLGDYSLKTIDKIMVMGSGRYFSFDDGKVNNEESKFRSIPKKPEEIYNMLNNNRNKKYLTISKDKPIKLKESVRIGKYKDRFNEFLPVVKNVSFKIDRRHWFDQFDNIGDIFDKQIESRPFNVSELD